MSRPGLRSRLVAARVRLGWRLVGRSGHSAERLAAAEAYRSALALADVARSPFAGDLVALPAGRDRMAAAATLLEALGEQGTAAALRELLGDG